MLAKLRILGLHLFILGAVAAAGAAASMTLARVPVHWTVPNFPLLGARPGEGRINPMVLSLAGLPADTDSPGVPQPLPSVRAITVSPQDITLRAGGRVVATIPIAHPSLNLSQITRAVANPSWISQPGPGVIDLSAALIMEQGTALTVAPPTARVLVLADRPGVLLGAHGASLRIASATVMSQRTRYTGAYRPFVLAEKRSRLWITNSRLAGLGWNWDDSYGVSWKTGSTGGATDSTFTGNYFGVYTAGVSGLVFTRDVVSDSYSYGFDPHSYSSRLTITKNTVTGNGRHGIILAEHVTRSIVEGNTVRANGANGIMIYQASSGNVIQSNMVAGNRGDGIVFEAAPGNRVIGNVVSGNRVGLHVSRTAPDTLLLAGNVVAGNALNSQGILSAAGNTIASDIRLGWDADWLVIIWVLGTVLVTVTLMSLTSCLLGGRRAR